jgi:hypothetical protein
VGRVIRFTLIGLVAFLEGLVLYGCVLSLAFIVPLVAAVAVPQSLYGGPNAALTVVTFVLGVGTYTRWFLAVLDVTEVAVLGRTVTGK